MIDVYPLPRTITEAEFGHAFEDAAALFGWKLAHFRTARTKYGWTTAVTADGKGFPDYVCAHPERGQFFFAELKTRYAKPTSGQRAWAEWLADAQQEHHFWWPPDWPEIIRRLAPPERPLFVRRSA